ncbi:MAG: lipopolysaccharide transport periplasmic protein LptA [Candidatus Methylomirabilales bacterium]
MRRWRGGIAWALSVLVGTSVLAVQTPSVQGDEPGQATTVTADRLEVSRQERRAIYTGNVVARTTDLTVTADRMEFNFDEKMEVVERMVAVGNVHITRSDGTKAVSERATYDVPQEKVVLEGHPRAWRQENVVSGTRITLFIKEDRQVVEGDGKERVTAVIYPKRSPGQAR